MSELRLGLDRTLYFASINIFSPEFSGCNKSVTHITEIIRLRNVNRYLDFKLWAHQSTESAMKNCAAACKCRSLATNVDLQNIGLHVHIHSMSYQKM